jgi:hypothetical protein
MILRRKNGTNQVDVFDASTIERDISDVVLTARREPSPDDYAPPRVLVAPPLPPYVSHADGIDEIARLSSQAVIEQHEAAAKSIETLAVDIKVWAAAHERALEALAAAAQEVQATAQHFREIGKADFERLQQSSVAIDYVRKACQEMRDKITPPQLAG